MVNRQKIENADQLQLRIATLQLQLKQQEASVKDNYEQLKSNLKPANVVKNTFAYVAETPEIQKTLINTAIGFLIGYASKKATEVFTEETLNKTLERLSNHYLDKWEQQEPKGILSFSISALRKFTPKSSPIYRFVRPTE